MHRRARAACTRATRQRQGSNSCHSRLPTGAATTMADSHVPPKPEVIPKGIILPLPLDQQEAAIEAGLQTWSSQLRLLIEVNAALAGALDPEEVHEQILSRLRESARLAHASIYRLIPEERMLRCVAESGYITPEALRTLSLDGPGVVAYAARTAEGPLCARCDQGPTLFGR